MSKIFDWNLDYKDIFLISQALMKLRFKGIRHLKTL